MSLGVFGEPKTPKLPPFLQEKLPLPFYKRLRGPIAVGKVYL
jgi:hypothetical protein